jgi:hypothetical protein
MKGFHHGRSPCRVTVAVRGDETGNAVFERCDAFQSGLSDGTIGEKILSLPSARSQGFFTVILSIDVFIDCRAFFDYIK